MVQFCWCWTTCCTCVLNFVRVNVSGQRKICPLQWGFVIEVEANLISTPVSDDVITCFFAVLQFWDVTFSLRRILVVRIWHDLLCFIGYVNRSREEHLWLWLILVLIHQMFVSEVDQFSPLVLVWMCFRSIRCWFLMWILCIVIVWLICSWTIFGLLQNLLWIRFQHEGNCEAWTPGLWLPWWII